MKAFTPTVQWLYMSTRCLSSTNVRPSWCERHIYIWLDLHVTNSICTLILSLQMKFCYHRSFELFFIQQIILILDVNTAGEIWSRFIKCSVEQWSVFDTLVWMVLFMRLLLISSIHQSQFFYMEMLWISCTHTSGHAAIRQRLRSHLDEEPDEYIVQSFYKQHYYNLSFKVSWIVSSDPPIVLYLSQRGSVAAVAAAQAVAHDVIGGPGLPDDLALCFSWTSEGTAGYMFVISQLTFQFLHISLSKVKFTQTLSTLHLESPIIVWQRREDVMWRAL